MSRKSLLIIGISALLLVNGSILGTLHIVEILKGPSEEELAALKAAEKKASLDAIYANLEPLETFKSKKNHLRSIGEAIGFCEKKLHQTVKVRKSWDANMIESRFVPSDDLYKIFLYYETVATASSPAQTFEVTCEVSGETGEVSLWKATPTN
ncbi:MAG: hypothetical protein AAFZ92_00840 [Pseudomonadota bacterium]